MILEVTSCSIYAIEDHRVQPVFVFYYFTPLFFFLITMRNWCVVLAALDRLVHIAAPVWAKSHMKPGHWTRVLLMVGMLALLPSVPFYFLFVFRPWTNQCSGQVETTTEVLLGSLADKVHATDMLFLNSQR